MASGNFEGKFQILNKISNRRKASNIKSHLTKQYTIGKSDDSQVILYELLLESEKKRKELEEKLLNPSNISNSPDIKSQLLKDINDDINSKDSSRINTYIGYQKKIIFGIGEDERYLDELDSEIDTLKSVVGVRVQNYVRTYSDQVSQETTIYDVKSYNDLICRINKDIEKEESNTMMAVVSRLKAYRNEYLTDKRLSRFR